MNIFFSRHLYFCLFFLAMTMLYVLGPVFSWYLNGKGYDKPIGFDIIPQALLYILLFCVSYFIFYQIARRSSIVGSAVGNRRILYALPLALCVLAMVFYLIKNGFVFFNIESYEDRYYSNFGLGLYTLLMQLFYFFVAGYLILKKPRSIKFVFGLAILFALFTFALLGGYRQLGFGVLVGVFVWMYIDGRINIGLFFSIFIFFLVTSLVVAVFRYGYEDIDFSFILERVLIYFYDGLTPHEAHLNIYDYVVQHGPPGGGIILNQMASYVPRSIWSGKPEVMLNGGNFYSLEVLNRDSVVTYSPTLIGESLLAHGDFFFLTAIPLAAILAWIDCLISSKSYLGVLFVLFSFVLVFNLYREGFYVFLSKIVIVILFAFLFGFISRLYFSRKVKVV